MVSIRVTRTGGAQGPSHCSPHSSQGWLLAQVGGPSPTQLFPSCQGAGLKGQMALPCPLRAARHMEQSSGSHTLPIPHHHHQPGLPDPPAPEFSQPPTGCASDRCVPHQPTPVSSWPEDPKSLQLVTVLPTLPSSGHYTQRELSKYE